MILSQRVVARQMDKNVFFRENFPFFSILSFNSEKISFADSNAWLSFIKLKAKLVICLILSLVMPYLSPMASRVFSRRFRPNRIAELLCLLFCPSKMKPAVW